MAEFKKQVYIQWYPSDWLNNPQVRRLKPDVKGFYIDFICQLFYCFPYGHCSLLNNVKAKRLQKQVNQKANHVVVREDNEEDSLWVDLSLNATLAEQLKVVDNIERELHTYLPYTPEQVALYIKQLEETGIISRTSAGILYVRRMVKDFKKRVVAYLNGSKGGNPNFKKGKKAGKTPKTKEAKGKKAKSLENQVNQAGYPSSNSNLYTVTKGNKVGEYEGKEQGNYEPSHEVHPFPLQQLFDKPWADICPDGVPMIKGLSEAGFQKWKEFVDWVAEHHYTELWQAKALGPKDFQTLVEQKGFTRPLWEPVVEKILSTGIEAKHNLYFRIPEFMKIVARNAQGGGGKSAVSVGEVDYSQQAKW